MKYNYTKHIQDDIEVERKRINPNFRCKVILAPNDTILAGRFMEAELAVYNKLINVLGAQFNRDSSFYYDVVDRVPHLFGSMCATGSRIYNVRSIPETLSRYEETIDQLSNNVKFTLSEALSGNSHILPKTRKRMGQSVLEFYVKQATVRQNNSLLGTANEEGEIQYSAPCDSLTPLTSYNKRHLQIDRGDVKIQQIDGKVFMSIPYLNKPIEILDNHESVLQSAWNYMIVRQRDKSPNGNTPWVIDFKRVNDNFYFYKLADKQGRSGIFEMGKKWH